MSWKRSLTASNFLERIQFRLAIKTAVTATVALFAGIGFSQLFDRPDNLASGLWTLLAAIVVVQAHLGGTYYTAWVRFLGTFVGCCVGYLAIIFLGFSAISLGLSIFITVALCSALNIKDSIRIASMSVAILLLFWGANPGVSPWTFALFRFVDSCLGILIAVVVAQTFWPMQATRKLRLSIVKVLRNLKELHCISVDMKKRVAPMDRVSEVIMRETVELLRASRQQLEESRIEIHTRSSIEDWIFLLEHLEASYEIVTNLRAVRKFHLKKFFDKNLSEATDGCNESIGLALEELATTLQERQVIGQPINVLGTLEKLNEELKRFREIQTTRLLSMQDAESFFVYFYSLKELAEEIIKIDYKVHALYGDGV